MNNEQKQRAIKLITYWRDRSITTMPEEHFVSGDCMTDLLQEMIDAPEPEQPNQSEQHLEMVNTPAPSVPDWLETTRFLTDVTTAAGLLEHGLRDKGLAQRIGDFAYKYRMLAAAPAAPERDQELARDAERWLSQRDLELLVTFGMQADDCDADGHTLSKEQTRRLCELGVLRNVGFGRHEMTAFGDSIFGVHFSQGISLPLHTHAEYNAAIERNKQKGGKA